MKPQHDLRIATFRREMELAQRPLELAQAKLSLKRRITRYRFKLSHRLSRWALYRWPCYTNRCKLTRWIAFHIIHPWRSWF